MRSLLGQWSTKTSMTAGRGCQAWVKLASGDVLMAGGFSDSGVYATCLIYRWRTGTIEETGSMHAPRWGHSLTLLQDGNVLACGGGTDSAWSVSSAELYVTESGTWTEIAASMNGDRQCHAAALLADGTVLLAGGYDNSELGRTATAETYDPISRTFTARGSMGRPRAELVALTLPNGDALAIGGYSEETTEDPIYAETYNPTSHQWTDTGHMHAMRWNPSAALLDDGTVLAAGGYYALPSDWSVDFAVDTAETYDPATRTWTLTYGNLSVARSFFPYSVAVKLPNGRVVIAGGQTVDRIHGAGITDAVDVYVPSERSFVPGSALPRALNGQTFEIVPSGDVVSIGGFVSSTGTHSAAWIVGIAPGIAAVRKALLAAAAAALGGVPTQHENVEFKPPAAAKWARVFFLPNQPSVNTLGIDGRDIVDGIMQIDICYSRNSGTAEADADSDGIRAAFPAGASYTANGQIVTIRNCGRSQGRLVEQWWRVSNTVVWEARLRR